MNLYKLKQVESCDFYLDESFKNNDAMFELVQLQSHYDCYSFKIAEARLYSGLMIRIKPRIELFTMGGLIMMCEVSLDYTILDSSEPLQDIIVSMLEDAHKEFIKFFDDKTRNSISMKYKPEFKWQGLTEQIESRLA